MTLPEIFLTPIYIFLLHLFFKSRRKRLPDDTLKRYHKQAFWIKILASLLFMVYYTYMTGGDTRSLYFLEGKNLFHLLLKDSHNWKYIFTSGKNFNENLLAESFNYGYFQSESNYMVIRLTALLSFLTFGQYTLIGLFFACFAFSGLWKLFMFFYERKPELHKAFAIAILFFPSVVFWSSGLMKDTLCMGALGWFTYSVGHLLKGKYFFKNLLIVLLAGYLLAVVKIYILLAYIPFFFLFLLLDKLRVIKAAILKAVLVLAILSGVALVFVNTYSYIGDTLGAYALENLTSNISYVNNALSSMNGEEGAESNFNLGAEFDGTMGGIVKMAPFAIAASFFRPFIWEAHKPSQLLAALESLVLIYFTLLLLFRLGPLRFIRFSLSDPMIMYCMIFALVFGVFVGTSTVNFGTLVRYKIPCLPFYTIALFLLNQKWRQLNETKKPAILKNQEAAALT